jgi:hypothetical protein
VSLKVHLHRTLFAKSVSDLPTSLKHGRRPLGNTFSDGTA